MISPSTRSVALACACAAMFGLGAPASAGASRLGSAPALPAGAHIASDVASGTPVHVTVTLQPRDPAALEQFATAVSTPGSPLYRGYITTAQFAQRFGATPAQVQAVEASLRAHGLNPGPPAANNLSISLDATAGELERAFAVSLVHATLRNGTTAIVNRQAPSLDPTIAPKVQAVLGLDTLSQAKPLLVRPHAARGALRPNVVTGGPQPCAAASAAATSQGGLTADQIASAYGVSGLYGSGGPGGAADFGAGQNVAVLELEPYDPSDIAAYEQCYGTNVQIADVAVDGGAGSGSGSGEAALDIENVIGLAPQAGIVVYEGPNSGAGPYDTFKAIITQHAAQVVTASWGQCEFINGSDQAAAENTLFQEAAAQGQSIFSASGDEGAEDCFPTPPTAQVDDPASQPFVTGVGGTSVEALGPRPSESVWNDGLTVGASGGGVSSFWKMPTYQSGAPGFLHVIGPASSGSTCGASSGFCRQVPDVAADADPATGYVIYWNGNGAAGPGQPTQWQVVGGTSAAAPAWAALIALANASAACQGAPIGFANPALYNAAASGYASNFNDITQGDNDMTGANGGKFAAGPNYDMATGLGSPNGAALAAALCTDSIALANPGAQRSVLGAPVSLQIKATETRGVPVHYSAEGLPGGLSIDGASGKITGRPRHIGTSTVTVTVTNAATTTSQASFDWAIQGKPTLSRVALARVGAARPALSFALAAGRNAPQLKTVSVALPRGLAFSRSRATVSVRSARGGRLKFSATLRNGALVLNLRKPTSQVRVTISYPRLRVKGSHAARVTLTVRTTDALKRTTALKARVRPTS